MSSIEIALDRELRRTRNALRRLRATSGTPGAGVQDDQMRTLQIGDICWPCVSNVGHGLWRAQELTLGRRRINVLRQPILDLGCGDGIFGELAGLGPQITGVDIDEPSLAAARRRNPQGTYDYGALEALPYSACAFMGLFSNSVFEHVANLQQSWREAFRVLKPGGVFLFCMTLGTFTDHLRRLAGPRDAATFVKQWGHRQQPSRAEVFALLEQIGFRIESALQYQPIEMTRLIRTEQTLLRQISRRLLPPSHNRMENFAAAVRSSIAKDCVDGACIYITASKPTCTQ